MKLNRKKKFIIILFACILQIVLFFSLLLYSPGMQTFFARQLVKILTNHYQIEASIEKLYFLFPNKIVLEGIEVKDSLNIDILTAEKIAVSINSIKFKKKIININKLNIYSPHINTYIDTTGKNNFDYIINKFKNNDTTQISFQIACEKFILNDANFSFVNHNLEKKDSLLDFNNFEITKFSTIISDIKYNTDTDSLSIAIEDFNCFENNSRYKIKQIKSKVCLTANELSFADFNLKLNDSELICSQFQIKKTESKNFDWRKDISIKVNIDSLIFDISELTFFLPEYNNVHEKIHLSGNISGKYSNFKCDNLKLSFGLFTNLFADLSVNGLPDYNNTFIFGNIENLNTTVFDIQKIINELNPKAAKKINISNKINFSKINFKGNITGLMNDFVTYGIFTTNLGILQTDAGFVSDFDNDKYKLKGNIIANNVEIGKIINDTATLGKISLNATINGNFSRKNNNTEIDSENKNNLKKFVENYNFFLNTDCNISNASILGYNYQNININGELNNDLFEGKINIDDQNLKFLFDGKYFMSSSDIKDNELNFRSYIKANLSGLKLLPDSVNSNIILYLNSDIKGDFLNFPEGNFNINNLKFTYNERLLQVPSLNIKMFLEQQKQILSIKSDLLEFDANGNFNFSELKYYIHSMLNNYLSAFISEAKKPEKLSNNELEFILTANRINDIIQMFIPNISIPEELIAGGVFSSKNNSLITYLSLPQFIYDSIFFWGNELNIICTQDTANIYFTSQEIGAPNKIFENLNIKSTLNNNRNLLNIVWNNNDSLIQNFGNFTIFTKFQKNEEKSIPIIDNLLYKAEFMVNNKLWKSKETNIHIDANKNYLNISDFTLKHANESISVKGEISKDPFDKLNFKINNFDLSVFNSFFEKNNFKIEGLLNLESGSIADVFNSYRINLFPEISKLRLYEYGTETTTADTLAIDNINFNIEYNSDTKEFLFKTESSADFIKNININYSPLNDKLLGKIEIEDFDVSILSPLVKSIGIHGLDNNISIDVNIGGSLSSPLIDGNIKFSNTKLTYELLNLQVILNDTVQITNNAILFRNFAFEDREKNKGRINGGLYHNNFKNFRFDFNIFCRNLKVLNTNEKDNDDYYGTVYGTGNVKIAGNSKRFGIDVTAKTEANSVFVIPMSSAYKQNNNDFITFIKQDNSNLEISYDLPKSNSDYYLIIDVEITPDAIIQIDFDPKIGDIIRAKAKGNLKIEYNTNDNFYIYGETEIQEGNYLFTLENIINKKFTIQQGGTITWTGNPIDANIDIYATYKTRSQLKDLFIDTADSIEFNQSANVNCNMHLSGKLTKPDIVFSIEIPNGNEKVKSQLSSLSQDEINKQFAFLLIMNRFYAQSQNDIPNIGNITSNTMSTTSFELISNQISNWLSQINKDLDIGVKYQPGTAISGQELELALSYQTKNEKFLINGNFGYNDNINTNTNTMVGDIEIQYKVTPSGNFRIKGFSRKNDEFETIYGPYTAGIGVFYTKDFNTFKEMIFDIWDNITFKNLRNKKTVNRNNQNNTQ